MYPPPTPRAKDLPTQYTLINKPHQRIRSSTVLTRRYIFILIDIHPFEHVYAAHQRHRQLLFQYVIAVIFLEFGNVIYRVMFFGFAREVERFDKKP